MHGPGKMIYADGREEPGVWKNGRMVSEISADSPERNRIEEAVLFKRKATLL